MNEKEQRALLRSIARRRTEICSMLFGAELTFTPETLNYLLFILRLPFPLYICESISLENIYVAI